MTTWTPMRWPETWRDPAALDLLKGSAIDYLLIADGPEFAAVRSRAQQLGIQSGPAAPSGVQIVQGAWPGVQVERARGQGAGSGPTGVPWVDSNGWAIRLNRALYPAAMPWVDAPPPEKSFVTADAYLIAIADSAAYAGRWIVTLDAPLAKGLLAGDTASLKIWRRLTATDSFFAAHQEWLEYNPRALVGVVSDFAGDNEFFSRELLNLMGRAGLQYRVVPKDRIAPASFESLRALSYTDVAAPSDDLRRRIVAFVEAGGLLIAAPKWGAVNGAPAAGPQFAGYSTQRVGKGSIALAKDDPADPYTWANDAALLVSHRYDLVRFWNGGATGSFYTVAPGGKKALVHLLFYAELGPDSATVRVAGEYRAARVATVDNPHPQNVAILPQGDATEVHLPPVSQYVALELDV